MEAVAAAVERSKAAFFHNYLDVNRDALEQLVSSLHDSGTNRHSFESYMEALDAITTADVRKALDYSLSTRPVMFSTGQTYPVPNIRELGF